VISEEIRPIIEEEMARNSRANIMNPDYWYPLAIATYGFEEVLQAINSMVTFRTSMWEKTREFEELFGEKYGAEAVMVNSGSSADLLMVFGNLEESGGTLRKGDEVLLPAVTWPTHLWSVLMAGLKPVLVDVDPETLNMSIDDLKLKVTERTRAIFPVHLMGNTPDMDAILEIADDTGSLLLEDCCEALGTSWDGASVGTIGQAGTFSFFFSHHITTMEGGMVLTRDADLAERLRLLRAHGWSRNLLHRPSVDRENSPEYSGLDSRYTFLEWGFNLRPTELQAGFGIEQLKRVDDFNEIRSANYLMFMRELNRRELDDFFSLPRVLPNAEVSWLAFAIMLKANLPFTRDQVTDFLNARGVETRPIVAGNLARHPVRERFPNVFEGNFPGADQVHESGFYTGLHPIQMEETIGRFVDLLDIFCAKHR
jgi:CDP-6-deoxy-D-xylo-4-hexulose-3-dehydrase